jgi:hypothetical protein
VISSLRCYGTRNSTLLVNVVPLAVVTWTLPVVAPLGTVVLMEVPNLEIVKLAAVPLKVTLVEPVSLFPRIVTFVPTVPVVGFVSTNGLRPTDRLKTVPSLSAPPSALVP